MVSSHYYDELEKMRLALINKKVYVSRNIWSYIGHVDMMAIRRAQHQEKDDCSMDTELIRLLSLSKQIDEIFGNESPKQFSLRIY